MGGQTEGQGSTGKCNAPHVGERPCLVRRLLERQRVAPGGQRGRIWRFGSNRWLSSGPVPMVWAPRAARGGLARAVYTRRAHQCERSRSRLVAPIIARTNARANTRKRGDTFSFKIPVWWRRAVLPSLPWVGCFLFISFFSQRIRTQNLHRIDASNAVNAGRHLESGLS